MKRVLICGGRDFNDWNGFARAMATVGDQGYLGRSEYAPGGDARRREITIIHGAARGADTMAAEWADDYGYPVEAYPADWDTHGRSAGYIRNAKMLEEGKPDLVISFPGGKGTKMMIDLATKAKVLTLGVKIMGTDNIYISELNKKAVELQTQKYKQLFIDKIQELKMLTPGQRAGIFRDLVKEEQEWLANMGADYDQIMQAVEAMDKTQS